MGKVARDSHKHVGREIVFAMKGAQVCTRDIFDGVRCGVTAARIIGNKDTRFYLDPDTGAIRFIADDGAKGFRVLHMALHTFDFVGSPIREILLVLAMLGVTAVCAFGVWLGARKLARGGKLDNIPNDEPPVA